MLLIIVGKFINPDSGRAPPVSIPHPQATPLKPDTIKQRLKNRFARLPSTISLAEELIVERREEAKREAGE